MGNASSSAKTGSVVFDLGGFFLCFLLVGIWDLIGREFVDDLIWKMLFLRGFGERE